MFREYFLWLMKLMTVVVIVFVLPPLLLTAIFLASGDAEQLTKQNDQPKVAVLELNGVIMDSKEFLKNLQKQVQNDSVKAIVVRIDSPGGAVGPSQDIYSEILKLRDKKPIVASMGSVAASGGLYAAMAATKVFCQPGTLTGSIGVIMQVPNFTKIAEKVGVDVVTIKAGRLKDVGNSFRPMEPEEKELLDETLHSVHDVFIQAVADGRKLSVEKVRTFADGRVIVGSKAKELGLIDEFGDVYDAARAALRLAKIEIKDEDLPNLVYQEDKLGALKKLFETALKLPGLLSPSASIEYRAYFPGVE